MTPTTFDEVRGTSSALYMRATPADRARELLARWVGADQVTIEDGAFKVAVDPARAGELNRRLVNENVEVSELRRAERSLEDVFLQLTEGSEP